MGSISKRPGPGPGRASVRYPCDRVRYQQAFTRAGQGAAVRCLTDDALKAAYLNAAIDASAELGALLGRVAKDVP
jgi:hypothetical protein